MFRSVKLQTYRDEEHQNGGTDAERFEKIGPHVQDGGRRKEDREDHPCSRKSRKVVHAHTYLFTSTQPPE